MSVTLRYKIFHQQSPILQYGMDRMVWYISQISNLLQVNLGHLVQYQPCAALLEATVTNYG